MRECFFMLRSFAHYYKPHWKLFVFDMICALVAAGCDLVQKSTVHLIMQK